jgi:AraC-like DNA-binding protein
LHRQNQSPADEYVMLCRTYTPGPPLSDFVASFWLIEGCVLPHAFERVLPSGNMFIVINLAEPHTRVYNPKNLADFERLDGSLLCGAHSRFVIVDAGELRDTMGIAFKPGGAFPFFKTPPHALQDAHASLRDFWGAEGASLREQLLEARKPCQRFAVLENLLLRKIAKSLGRHRSVRFAQSCFDRFPASPISHVIDQVGLSERHFIQLFSSQVGLTPKRYCRVQRFQKALANTFRAQAIDWSDIALDCGYYDQAHFIHEFTEFSGLTPATYLKQRSGPGNHIPIAH